MTGSELTWEQKVEKINKSKEVFKTGVTRDWAWREKHLKQLEQFLINEKEEMRKALDEDLGRPALEFALEWVNTKNAIQYQLKNGKKMMKNVSVSNGTGGMVNIPNTLYRHPEPLGTVLVMGAWNYPFDLVLNPLAGAIGAGNTAVVKPSEVAKASAKLMMEKLPKYLDNDAFPVFVEGPEGSSKLLKERYDLIFFTGGTNIGRIVMKAAAEYLTPVILELGGKNPCWIDKTCDMKNAARRLMYGKTINSGQICISPNYVLCENETKKKLLDELKLVIKEWYDESPTASPCYSGKMIHDRHFNRLVSMIDNTKGKLEIGGKSDESKRFIEPTVVSGVKMDDILMKDEIFGPILPIIDVKDFDEALSLIKMEEKPLAAYCFAKDKKVISRYVNEVTSGGMCINDTIMHIAPDSLPFGGVGNSGMGAYHGAKSFECFSHYKSVMESGTPQFMLAKRSAPFSADEKSSAFMERMMTH